MLTQTEDLLTPEEYGSLKTDLYERTDIFRAKLYSGLPADVHLLRIDLIPEARSEKLRLRNYS